MINKLKSKLSKDKHLSELLKGSSIAFIFKIVGMGFGYFFTLLIARWYGADTMGLYALSLTMLNIFVTIGLFGFDNALVKFISEYNSHDKEYLVKEVYLKVLYITIPLGFVLWAILYLNAGFFSKFIFKKEQLTLFLEITSFAILPFVLLRINAAFFRGFKNIKLFSFFDSLGVMLFSLIGLVVVSKLLVLSGNSLVMTVQVVSIVLLMLGSFVNVTKYISIFKIISNTLLEYREILKVSFPMLLTSSMALIMSWTDIIMLGIFRSESEVGIYSVVVKIAAITSIMLIVVGAILGPKISEFYSQNDMKGLEHIIKQSTKLIFLSSLPILVIFFIFPNEILSIFGEIFKLGATSLIILSMGQLFSAYSGDAGMFLKMTDNQMFLLKLNLFALSFNIILNYILINNFGINGAAIATMIALIIAKIIANIFIKQKYNFNFYLNLKRKMI